MSQVLQLYEQTRQALTQAAQVQVPSDLLAWVIGLQVSSVTKAYKYGKGNVYREMVKSLSPVYRAKIEKDGITDPKKKWETWYDMGIKSLKAMKAAAGQLVTGGTQ